MADSEAIPSAEMATLRQPFNINNYVWVRLTEYGWKIHDDYYRHLGLDPGPYRDIAGQPPAFQRFQLWDLMQIFGPYSYLGGGGFFDGGDIWFSDPSAPTDNRGI